MKDRLKTRAWAFLFQPDTDRWLSILRIGLGLQLALYCLTLRPDWLALYAGDGGGLISRDLAEAILDLRSVFIPRLGWLVVSGGLVHLSEGTVLYLVWACLLGASVCLIAGLFCRPAAIVAWFLYLAAAKSGNLFSYGVDNFTVIGLFYLMIAPLPDRWALDWKRSPRSSALPARLGFHLRVLQIHLCVIYFFGGISKATGGSWWNGTSIWRALSGPPFDLVPLHLLISLRALLPLAGVLVCSLETGYPIFIWWRKTRTLWFCSVIGMHLSIGITMGLYLFSLVMIILNLAAFGPSLRWRGNQGRASPPGRRRNCVRPIPPRQA
ncbi:MAG: HTTM domain-containing protein [Chthoniobacterales bacterium]